MYIEQATYLNAQNCIFFFRFILEDESAEQIGRDFFISRDIKILKSISS